SARERILVSSVARVAGCGRPRMPESPHSHEVALPWSPARVTRVIRSPLGTSTAPVFVATDSGDAYVKTLENPEGTAGLVAELVGTSLARWLGLPTFDFSVLGFPSELLPIKYKDGFEAQSGPAFATR